VGRQEAKHPLVGKAEMGLLRAGIDLAQDDLVRDLDPSRLLGKPCEPSVATIFGCRWLAVSDFLFFLSEARVAAAAADVRPLPGPVVVVVEFVMMAHRLRQPIARGHPGDQQAEDAHIPIRMGSSFVASSGMCCGIRHTEERSPA
jgi:hypothetical protein